MQEEIPKAFWQGVEEFNQQQFYACHDTLEALWMEAPQLEKRFYQGVLQIAVGLYHLSQKNWKGSVILMGEGLAKLDYYYPDYSGIDVEQLMDETSQLLKALQIAGSEKVEEFLPLIEPQGIVQGLKLPKIQKIRHRE
jgi:predicted metal-dependent hydrolase